MGRVALLEHDTVGIGTSQTTKCRICAIGVDDEMNIRAHADADIATSGATVRTIVVTGREELVIARATQALGA